MFYGNHILVDSDVPRPSHHALPRDQLGEFLVQTLQATPSKRVDTNVAISGKGKVAPALKRIILSRLKSAGHAFQKEKGENYGPNHGQGGFHFAVSANSGEYCWWSTFSLSQMKRCKDQGLNVLAVFNPTMPGEDLTQLHVYGFNPMVILENLHQHRGVIMRAQLMRAVNVVDDNTSEIAGEISRLMEPMCNPNRLTESDIDALHTQAIRILRSRRFTGSESGAASKLKQALDAVLVRIRPTEDGGFRLFADKGDLTLETLESGSLRFATIVLNELEKQIVQQARQTSHTPVIDPGGVASRAPKQCAA